MRKIVPEHSCSDEASVSLANLGAAQGTALCCSTAASPSKVGPREWCGRKASSAANHRGLRNTPSLPDALAKENADTI